MKFYWNKNQFHFILGPEIFARMWRFQIWSQNCNRTTFDPFYGQKTVEIWQIWLFCRLLTVFGSFFGQKGGQMSSDFNFETRFGLHASWHFIPESRTSPRNFWLGGRILTGGRIQVSQNHLLPNSDFSLDFAHLIWEILENPKVLAKIPKIVFKNRDFWGNIPTGILNRGNSSPTSSPHGGDAHVQNISYSNRPQIYSYQTAVLYTFKHGKNRTALNFHVNWKTDRYLYLPFKLFLIFQQNQITSCRSICNAWQDLAVQIATSGHLISAVVVTDNITL